MEIHSDDTLYSVVRREHMFHNDFFLRWIEFIGPEPPVQIKFTCYAGDVPCRAVLYGPEEVAARLAYSKEELARYRQSSLGRILGLERRPENAFLHEHFAFFSSQPVTALSIEAGGARKIVQVEAYQSPNRYCFPMKGTLLVTDTYPSVNSHRWCRNSEFAFDVGLFDETLARQEIAGRPVLAACGGVVEEAFDGLDDTTDHTDLDEVEHRFGEHARIDGNHVLLRHQGGELSLYAHLAKGSVAVKKGEAVTAGQLLGRVGSSGSSWTPHLHFHIMRDGLHGPGVPVVFEDLKTLFGEACGLEDTVNIVRAGFTFC